MLNKGQIMGHNLNFQKSAQRGVVLIEAMVAILLFAVGVLAIAGLQATMIDNTASSKYRAVASYIAQQRIGMMWADPTGTSVGLYSGDFNVAELPSGTMNVAIPVAGGPYVIRVGWTAPGETPAPDAVSPPCFMTVAHCFVTNATISPSP